MNIHTEEREVVIRMTFLEATHLIDWISYLRTTFGTKKLEGILVIGELYRKLKELKLTG
jgi:hypothetical protein